MPKHKRKGATAKLAEAVFNKDQERSSSIEENVSHKDSTVMEQMQLVKKEKKNKQKKTSSPTTCGKDSKPGHTGKDGNKDNISSIILSNNKYKNKRIGRKELQKTCNDVEKDVVDEEHNSKHRNYKDTSIKVNVKGQEKMR